MFFGILGVTSFGLLFTPVFYTLVRRPPARNANSNQKAHRNLPNTSIGRSCRMKKSKLEADDATLG